MQMAFGVLNCEPGKNMKPRMQLHFQVTRLLVLCAALVLPAIAGCAGMYSAKTIEGTVVDAETGKPLGGVVIVAQWRLWRNTVGDEKALLHVTETVTDKMGRYAIPAWGPKVLPPLADFHQGNDPLLLLFKSGYLPGTFRNPNTLSQNPLTEDTTGRRPPVGEFIWNGKVLTLTRWSGDLKEYVRRFDGWISALPHNSPNNADPKSWRSIPRMVNVLHQEDKRIQSLDASVHISSWVAIERLSEEDRQFLRSFNVEQ